MRGVALVALLIAAACASRESGQDAESFKPAFPYGFEGNAAVKSSRLVEAAKLELRAFETHGHKAADLDDAAYAMRQYLRREGFAHSKVTVRMEPSPDAVSSATFEIVEGPKTRWGTITFPGATVHDEAHLRQFFVFENKKRGLLGQEGEPAPFRRLDLQAGIGRVAGLYLGDGYYRVKAGPPKISWSEDQVVADVAVPIEEGRLYTVRDVEVVFEGPADSESEIRSAVEAFEGRPYHSRIPVRVSIDVRSRLSKEGRVAAKVESAATVDDATATAAVKVVVRPGPKIRVAGVSVRGNDRTRQSFMLGKAKLEPGELLTRESLDQALEDLYGTGLFKSVRVEPVLPEGVESRKTDDVHDAQVEIAVEELLARSVDFEVGWGSYELLRAAVRYRDRNLFGTGRDLEIEPAASLRSVGADFRFFDRHLLGKNNTVEVLSGFLLRDEPSFDMTSYRVEAAVRHKFSEELTGRFGYRFLVSNASDLAVLDLVDLETAFTSGPFATIEYDGRDNPILPTRGFFADAGVALSASALGANVDFVDWYVQASAYQRLDEDLVLAENVRVQTRDVFGGEDTLPIQLRLFLGGATSVRSYYEGELGPFDQNKDPLGGLTALQSTIELRQRLAGDLHGAVFYDVGTVGEDSFDFSNKFGQALGVGLRYYFPMGPVRLDVAYNFGARFASDSNFAVHFSFGFSF